MNEQTKQDLAKCPKGGAILSVSWNDGKNIHCIEMAWKKKDVPDWNMVELLYSKALIQKLIWQVQKAKS